MSKQLTMSVWVAIGWSLALLGCGGGTAPGTAGGACRVSGEPCDAPLECLDNVCTTPGGTAADAGPGRADARQGGDGDIDPPADAATPAERTLTHSASQTIFPSNSVNCQDSETAEHNDNSYFRVFRLADFGIAGRFDVTEIELGIEVALSTAGVQPIELRVYSLSGPLALANLSLVASQSYGVPDRSAAVERFPIEASFASDQTIAIEVFTPEGPGNQFYIGSNTGGQSAPSYLMAAACEVDEPVDLASLGAADMHVVLNVVGAAFP